MEFFISMIIVGFIVFILFFIFFIIPQEIKKDKKNRIRVVKDQYDEGYSFIELFVYQNNHTHNQRGLFGGIRFLKRDNEYYFSLLKMKNNNVEVDGYKNNNVVVDGYKIFNINDIASCKVDSQMSIYTKSSLGKEVMYGDSTDVSSKTEFKVIFLFKDLTQKPLEFYGIQEECIYIEKLFDNKENLKIELSKCKVLTFEEIINSLPDKIKEIAEEEEILKEL